MSLLDEAKVIQEESYPGPKCGVYRWLATLDAALHSEAVELLAASEYRHVTIAAVIERQGGKVSEGTVSRHRQGKCSCPHE